MPHSLVPAEEVSGGITRAGHYVRGFGGRASEDGEDGSDGSAPEGLDPEQTEGEVDPEAEALPVAAE